MRIRSTTPPQANDVRMQAPQDEPEIVGRVSIDIGRQDQSRGDIDVIEDADIAAETNTANPAGEGEPDESPHKDGTQPGRRRRMSPTRTLAYGLLPGVALLLAMVAGYLKWWDSSVADARLAGVDAVHAATDGTIAMLSYQPGTVEKDLAAARNRLTGSLLDSYTSLTRNVVIPGAKQKQISVQATVPAASAVSATANRAVVLLFVDQSATVGTDPPTNTRSRIRVTLDKSAGRWLISAFEPL